jgi:hypothetical protein
MSQTRRLAAILSSDVAGYSRLMGADEEGTQECPKAHLRELVGPKIAEHRGRIVKNTGDGFLAEFASVVMPSAAVEIQRGMAEREPEVPEEQRIRFRIGVNLGDVIVEEQDIFGDGVNVAAGWRGSQSPVGSASAGLFETRSATGSIAPSPTSSRASRTLHGQCGSMRGRAVLLKPQTRDTQREVTDLFERALALDPHFVEAQSRLAITLAGRALDFESSSEDANIQRADDLAANAVAASPSNALAHLPRRRYCVRAADAQRPFPNTKRRSPSTETGWTH